jgi:hypothetical protein
MKEAGLAARPVLHHHGPNDCLRQRALKSLGPSSFLALLSVAYSVDRGPPQLTWQSPLDEPQLCSHAKGMVKGLKHNILGFST